MSSDANPTQISGRISSGSSLPGLPGKRRRPVMIRAWIYLVVLLTLVPGAIRSARMGSCSAQSVDPSHSILAAEPDQPARKTPSQSSRLLKRFRFSEPHLGTNVQFTFYSSHSGSANRAAGLAFAEVRRLDGVFSSYRPDSELAKLHQTHWTNHDSDRNQPPG